MKFTKLTAFVMALIILFSAVPSGMLSALAVVQKAPLQIAVVSDIHYYPQSLMGGKGAAWQAYCNNNDRQFAQNKSLVDATLNAITVHAKENGCKYLFVAGDLSKDSEYAGHVELAARLERFEKETGIQVLVIDGNHDINDSGAVTFENGRCESTRAATPEDFRSIYKNLGYDLAYHTYTPPKGQKAGMLSYSVRLAGGYRLIALDVSKYSSDSTSSGLNEHETGGNISKCLMAWTLNEIADAKRCGETVIGLTHNNLVNQFDIEQSMFQDFVVDNWMETAETLADAGMHFCFTGHMHINNISSHVSDKGETLYDCETASLTGYPNSFREVLLDNTGNTVKASYKTLDADCVQQIVSDDGVVYKKPYKNTFSFKKTYGQNGLAQYGADMAESYLTTLFDKIKARGGLLAMLTASGVDLTGIINNAIKGGLTVGNTGIFTTKNIMSFVEDLAGQIDKDYISHPEVVKKLIYAAAEKLVSMKVSDYPCTKFIDSMGFGDPDKPGTLQDAAYSVMAYFYNGNEDISDDVFIKDFIDNFKNRSGAKDLYNTVMDIVLNDIVKGELLKNLDFNPDTLFPKGYAGQAIGICLKVIVNALFSGNNSYLNIIDSTLSVVPAPYNSLNSIVNLLLQEYLTQSQFDSLGCTISELISSMVIDNNPGFKMDYNCILSYNGSVKVIPTVEDYRLPSQVAVTFGSKTDSTRSIDWFTKYSVSGTDIELVPYSAKPVFTGKATTGKGIARSSERVVRGYPGVDLGLTGFLSYEFTLVRHTIKLTGLKPGQKYCYRVGDASKGWWSPPGIIETANDSNSFTFFHMSDPQAQDELQYETWAGVVKTAYNLYPQSKFIMSTGDLTDNSANVKQWKWLLNTASSNLRNTVLMPTTGNHEGTNYADDQNFILPDAPKQNRSSGVYYSFDYNNAHFIVLNTNNLSNSNALSDEQLAWLKKDAAASKAQWKIVALHKAMYSNGSHYNDKDVAAIRKQLCSLLPALGIDLVLQGHDHVYLRTDAMSGNKVVASQTKVTTYKGGTYTEKLEPKGTVYAISACAGMKFYLPKSSLQTDLVFPRAQKIVSVSLPVFSAIQISGNNLYFDAYTVDSGKTKKIDSFAIEKTAATAANRAAA